MGCGSAIVVFLLIGILGVLWENFTASGRRHRAEQDSIAAATAQQDSLREIAEARQDSIDAARAEAESETQARQDRIQAGFDPWDGNHRQLEALIKETLNDPDSYKHEETVYKEMGDTLWVRTRFRARNMLGGMVRQQVIALADVDGNVLAVLAHQYRGNDGEYHDLE